jgi:hypothetical protein
MGKQLPVQGLTLANTCGEYAAPGKLAEGEGFEPTIRFVFRASSGKLSQWAFRI